jgi:hypothetical protein
LARREEKAEKTQKRLYRQSSLLLFSSLSLLGPRLILPHRLEADRTLSWFGDLVPTLVHPRQSLLPTLRAATSLVIPLWPLRGHGLHTPRPRN